MKAGDVHSSVDAERSAVVMLGAHEFPHLEGITEISALTSSSKLFKAYLLRHKDTLGIESDEFVLDLFDCNDQAGVQTELIEEFLRKFIRSSSGCRQRNVILHYAGHGLLLGDDRRLFLAVRRSKSSINSSINIGNLADVLATTARFSRKLIFLDCCFSGAAARYFLSDPNGLAHIIGSRAAESLRQGSTNKLSRGSAMLCAVGKDNPASGELYNGATLFTGAVLEATGTHDPENPRITMQELRDRVTERLEEMERIELPQLFSLDQAQGDIASHLHVFPTGDVGSENSSACQAGDSERTTSFHDAVTAGRHTLALALAGILGVGVPVTLSRDSLPSDSDGRSSFPAGVPVGPLDTTPASAPLPLPPAPAEGAISLSDSSRAQTSPERVPVTKDQPVTTGSTDGVALTRNETPVEEKSTPSALRTVEDFRLAIAATSDKSKKEALKVEARSALADDMNFGVYQYSARPTDNVRHTDEVKFISYSPAQNVLNVRYKNKVESYNGKGQWEVLRDSEAIVSMNISRFDRLERGPRDDFFDCPVSRDCIIFKMVRGECPDFTDCKPGAFHFATNKSNPRVKRMTDAIYQIMFKLEGRPAK